VSSAAWLSAPVPRQNAIRSEHIAFSLRYLPAVKIRLLPNRHPKVPELRFGGARGAQGTVDVFVTVKAPNTHRDQQEKAYTL
jgi:hypothetical protein